MVDNMILATTVKPIVKDYGTIYEAQLKVDVSPGAEPSSTRLTSGNWFAVALCSWAVPWHSSWPAWLSFLATFVPMKRPRAITPTGFGFLPP